MKRLDFALPDFVRFSWTSDAARDLWEPRVERVAQAFEEVQWRAVAAGVRRCAILRTRVEEYVAFAPVWADDGLASMPLALEGVPTSSYAAVSLAPVPGRPSRLSIALGALEDVLVLRDAFDARDDDTIGKLLGYPACCRRFFVQTWTRDRFVDSTWTMATNTLGSVNGTRELRVSGPPLANILWRWAGVRAVPHLPCSFTCKATVRFAQKLIDIGLLLGFDEEMDWLQTILSWPVEWSALHGIAEIRTPVVKIATRTDATAEKYVVSRDGETYPDEGATGLHFPFRTPARRTISDSPGFARGLDHAQSAWLVRDNGFDSVAAMDAAHAPVVAAVLACAGGKPGNVLDLGCGNGALLRKIHDAAPTLTPFGVDANTEAIAHARELMPQFAANFLAADLFDAEALWKRRYRVGIFMPGRLTETDPEHAAALIERLRTRCFHVLAYFYGDWPNDALDMLSGCDNVTRVT